jgi:hypothetical protein
MLMLSGWLRSGGIMETRWRVPTTFAAIFAVYFPIAWWLKTSYEPTDRIIELRRPYSKMDVDGFAFEITTKWSMYLADEPFAPQRSPMVLYEDGKRLGPPHSANKDISKMGLGRFSHWREGFIFSSSDNSDPNSNGRKYWAVRPKQSYKILN